MAIGVAVLLLGCSADGRTEARQPSTGNGDVVRVEAAGAVDLSALHPVDARAVALASPGEDLVVADGRFDDDVESHLRVWVAPSDDPRRAEAFDLDGLGPRSRLHAVVWRDEVVMTGVRCPEPFVPPAPGATVEPQTNAELCGSTIWDAWTFDPNTGEASVLLADVDLGAEGTLHPVVATEDRLLLSEGSAEDVMVSVSPDGTVDRFDGPTASVPAGASVGAMVCAVDEVVYALTPSDVEREAPGQRIERPVHDYFVLRRLDRDRWTELPLPASDLEAAFARAAGCSVDGLIVTSGSPPAERGSGNPPLLLRGDGSSTDGGAPLTWTAVSTDGLPTPRALQFEEMVDGYLMIQTPAPAPSTEPDQVGPVAVDLYVHRGGRWVRWARLDGRVQREQIAVTDAGVVALERPPDAPLRLAFVSG